MSKGASYIVPRAGTRKADIDQLASAYDRRMARREGRGLSGSSADLIIIDELPSWHWPLQGFINQIIVNVLGDLPARPRRAARPPAASPARSRYMPHMGAREIARAARRAVKGGAA